MIRLENVTKIYENSVQAVDNISFTVQEGEIFGLIGTSGCGKTTTLKMINRLVPPTSGTILVDGKKIHSVPPEQLRRNIGYVIQDVGLFPHYTIRENVAVVPRLLNWGEQRIDARVDQLLQLVGLDAGQFGDRLPEALSGGQQQRVGFARALAGDPPVILMDEPFGALDPITKEEVRAEFKNLLHRIGKTIVLVTHDVAEAFDMCDRVALMDGGRLRQVGSPRDLLFQPGNDFVSRFFDVNRFELELETVRMSDLLPFIEADMPLPEGSAEFTAELSESIAGVMDRNSALNRQDAVIEIRDGDSPAARLRADMLLPLFTRARQSIREENNG
ncbi:MAG: ATP-binding cassette domain-containing protein [Balneolaceae bacterium]|nr:ATP-binding cassette domain-containing protein [Balneolaceae bacterium]